MNSIVNSRQSIVQLHEVGILAVLGSKTSTDQDTERPFLDDFEVCVTHTVFFFKDPFWFLSGLGTRSFALVLTKDISYLVMVVLVL